MYGWRAGEFGMGAKYESDHSQGQTSAIRGLFWEELFKNDPKALVDSLPAANPVSWLPTFSFTDSEKEKDTKDQNKDRVLPITQERINPPEPIYSSNHGLMIGVGAGIGSGAGAEPGAAENPEPNEGGRA